MAYKPPLDEGGLQRLNLRSVRDWIEANKGKVKARPNRSVLYAGNHYDFEIAKALPAADRADYVGTPLWKCIETHRKAHEDRRIPFEWQTLEDVLKTIRDAPVIVDRDRLKQHFSSAYDCFRSLEGLARLLPDAKAVSRRCWDRLSEIFASNAEGDIRILDGHDDHFGRLNKGKALLRKEIDALLKNSRLSAAGRDVLLKKMTKYGAEFDRRYTDVTAQLQASRSQLKKGR